MNKRGRELSDTLVQICEQMLILESGVINTETELTNSVCEARWQGGQRTREQGGFRRDLERIKQMDLLYSF